MRLTYYIELSHAVFDAAAVACYTCVSASIVRGDTCDQQGAVGHLLEPGRKMESQGQALEQSGGCATKTVETCVVCTCMNILL